jgi:SRSO17 transposase
LGLADRFVSFVKSYAEHFKSYRRDVSEKARQYASGLMQAGSRKNIYAISEVVPDTDDRNLQQFITHSKWSAREVLDHVARDADELIGDGSDAALILDESGFAKQGKMSVGASRQYLGRLGKVDNGQVAVFGVLAKGRFATAIDTRLYLPKEWTADAQRCNKAGIPEGERVFKTKSQLALEIVEQARRNGVRFGWVGADAGYGSGPDFLFSLADAGHTFLIDVHKNFVIYGVDPQPKPGPSTKGRTPNRSISEQNTLSVQQFVQGCPTKDWRLYNVRETTRGSLKLRVLRKSVYVYDEHSGKGRRYELLVTESLDGQDRKYSLTNQKPSTSTRRLCWMQRQRYWVERCFEDGKSQCGMADYQLRLWNAWHHHMALVMMAMLFMLSEKLRMQEQCPLLSCADIERLLAAFLPRQDASPEQVLSHMNRRHEMRRRAIESHAKRNAQRRSKIT